MIGAQIRTVFALVTALAIAVTAPALSQQPAAEIGAKTSPSAITTAPVIIDGNTLFRLRGASAFPAAARAALVRDRIKAVAADPSIDATSVSITPDNLGLKIFAGKRLVVTIVDADAELEGLKLEQFAETIKTSTRDAIKTYRMERSPDVLRLRAVYAVVALALTAVAVIGFLVGSHWLLGLIDRRYKRRIQEVKIQSFRLIRADQIYAVLRGTIQFLRTIVVLVLLYIAVIYVLGLFPWSRPIATRTAGYVIEPLHIVMTSILDNIPNLIFITIIFFLARFVLRMTHLLFQAVERGTVRFSDFEAEWAIPTYKLVRLGIVALALVIAYPYIPGSDSDAFKGVSIFAGIILSLGSSSAISNIIAGYTMIYRRAYDVGDWIRIGETVGEVAERRLLVTHLRSWKNEAVVVPNSQLMNMEIVNFSELATDSGLILHTAVGIGYEVPWRQVEAMLIEAASRTEGLRSDPPPFVLEKALGDFAVTYELNAYCDDPKGMPALYSHLHRNILDVFNENGVQIMTPNYIADPATPKIVLNDRGAVPPAPPSTGIETGEHSNGD